MVGVRESVCRETGVSFVIKPFRQTHGFGVCVVICCVQVVADAAHVRAPSARMLAQPHAAPRVWNEHRSPLVVYARALNLNRAAADDRAGSAAAAPTVQKRAALQGEASAAVLVASGASAGAISRTLTAPLDRVKCLMQMGSGGLARETPLATLRAVYSAGGVPAFFQGNGANLVKVVPECSIRFWTHERVRPLLSAEGSRPSFAARLAAGGLAGVAACLCTYPLELVKTRLAVAQQGQYRGLLHCARHTVAAEGGAGALYKGLPAALIGIACFSAVELALYTHLKDAVAERRGAREGRAAEPLLLREALACGAVATAVAQVSTYPIALAKTRLAAAGMPGHPTEYAGLVDCLARTWRAEGARGLFRGFGPCAMKAVPAMSITYAVFESSKAWLTRGVAPL